MSTEPKRPQLSLDELHQLKWLLGGVLTLLGVWTVAYMDVDAWEVVILTTAATLTCLWWPTLPARLPALAHTLAFPAIVVFFIGDLWLTSAVLPAMVRLDLLLLLYRNVSYRQRRDDLQVIVLGLFLIVVAGVLTVSLVFAAQILIFTACALMFLLTITLTDAAQGGNNGPSTASTGSGQAGSGQLGVPPSWAVHADWPRLGRRVRELADWRVIALGAGLFAGVVAVSALLFLAIPRFQLENSLFLERFVTKKAKTGFNDSIRLGDVTDIQQDTGVALSVDVTDRTQAPASPYWRMLVLDDYSDGTFKLSPRLRSMAFARERTSASVLGEVKPRLGAAVYWTFYLESGVSKYLPLPGPWEVLRFREPQNFRLAAKLGLVELRDEPVTMTAYRVEGLEISGLLPDPVFAAAWRAHDATEVARGRLQNRLNLAGFDRTRLTQIVDEITGGASLAEPEFATRAGAWLREHHSYSLSPVIPRGEGDQLVRWLVSREPGHCELFAGSLVLLARAAGLPARVVTGFRGGTWNSISENYTVRNSDAHAWTEIFDAAIGAWRRADPLAAPEAQQAGEQKGEAALARRTDSGWAARLDSLRVFWYRRIVSFDQRSQEEALRALKTGAQQGGQRLREALGAAATAVRAWLAGPWDVRRMATVMAALAVLTGAGWAWRNFRFSILNFRFWRGERRDDPVRREAGRWLARLRAQSGAWREASDELTKATAELQRLRFGARATWPEPEKVFRRARHALRAARREPRRSPLERGGA